MSTLMTVVFIDNDILQEEVDRFLRSFDEYRAVFRAASEDMSARFQMAADGIDTLAADVVYALEPENGAKIFEEMNNNLFQMSHKPFSDMDFGYEPLDKDYGRFIKLADRTYDHQSAIGSQATVTARTLARNVLADYAEATIMFFSVVGAKLGKEYDDAMVKKLVRKTREIIQADKKDVIPWGPRPG